MAKFNFTLKIDRDLTNGEDEMLARFIRDGILPIGEGSFQLSVYSDEGSKARQAEGGYRLPVWGTLFDLDSSFSFHEDLFIPEDAEDITTAELLSSEQDEI